MDKLFNGATLGAFRILHQIGEGGMAKVYKAYQPSMERYVALKVLPSSFAEDPQFLGRFNREARTIASLEHRNILPVFDFGEQGGITYMAMRYVEGGTLKELLNKGRLTMHDVLDLMLQICSALDYAHRRGVIHRDVKPSNVMLDSEGAAYLMDFGIAKVVGKSGDLTATGVAIGTPAYMAPEQAVGGEVDNRTDIYAMGIMLYEMVVGRVPYQADTPMAVLMAHLRDPLPLPREMDPSVPEPVEAVIIKALAKNPEDRYQTAIELAEAFRKALQATSHKMEASTLVTLIREIQTNRPEPSSPQAAPLTPSGQRAAHAVDPRLKERMDQDYIDGLSAFWIRDWVKARACFQAVIEVDPNYKDAANRLKEVEKQIHLSELYSQAQEAVEKKDWREAQEKLKQLVALDKEYQKSEALLKTVELRIELMELYQQAEQLHQAGQWQAVINIFDRMKVLDPNAPDPKGLLSQARASLAEQQRLEKVRALYQRGLEALEAGKWKEALKLFEQVKAQQPGYGNVDQLIKRVQDEINRTRMRPTVKPDTHTKVAAAKPTPAAAEATSAPPPPAAEPEASVTLQVPRRRRVISCAIVGVVVLALLTFLGFVLFVPGTYEKIALKLGVITPQPSPLPTKPPAPTQMPFLYDDFQAASVNGTLDPGKWAIEGNCGDFRNYTRQVQDGVAVFNNKPMPDPIRCILWTETGKRIPGVDVGAMEASLNLVEQSEGGTSSQTIAFLSDYDGKTLQAVCGLRAREQGPPVQVFSVWETKNGKVTELAHQEEEALFSHWYTARLTLFPGSTSIECSFDGRILGYYQPENWDVLRQAAFARFLETERGPQSIARTLVDNVRLIPATEVGQDIQGKTTQVVQPAAVSLCPDTIKGWQAEFWGNSELNGDPKVCTDVINLNYFWEKGSPVPGKIPVDYFSARFTRTLQFSTGKYRFRLGGDDGIRLFIDNKLVLDQWHGQPFTIYSVDQELSAGLHDLRIDYFEGSDAASLSFTWSPNPDRAWANRTECFPPPEGLLEWWAGDGDVSNDVGGPELTLLNGAKFAPGIVDQAFDFQTYPSSSAPIALLVDPDPRTQNLQTITFETWVKLGVTQPGETNEGRQRIQQLALSSIERFITLGNKAVLRKELGGRLHFYMTIDGKLQHIWSEFMLPRGEFFHVAGTYDGKWMILYFNGEKVGALEVSGNVFNENDLYLSSDSEPLFGFLDEVSIYSNALSSEQIKAIYSAGPYGKCK